MKSSVLWVFVRLPGYSLSPSHTSIPLCPLLLWNVNFFSYGSASAGVKLKLNSGQAGGCQSEVVGTSVTLSNPIGIIVGIGINLTEIPVTIQ